MKGKYRVTVTAGRNIGLDFFRRSLSSIRLAVGFCILGKKPQTSNEKKSEKEHGKRLNSGIEKMRKSVVNPEF